jgi:hypothetical protein
MERVRNHTLEKTVGVGYHPLFGPERRSLMIRRSPFAKAALTGIAVLVLAGAGQAQIKIWASNYDGGADGGDHIHANALLPDGDLVVTGGSEGALRGRFDVATIRLDRETGDTVWVRRYNAGGMTRSCYANAIAADEDDNVLVTGTSLMVDSATGRIVGADYLTIKYTADGDECWVRTFDNSWLDSAVAVVSDRAGGCFVTGVTQGAQYDYLTVHYDSAGNELWAALFNARGDSTDIGLDMVLGPNGDLYVSGSVRSPSTDFDYATVKYDTATGDTLWVRTYDGGASYPDDDRACAIAVDDSGNVYVTGRAGETGTWYDAVTVKYSPDGTRQWVNRTDAGENAFDGAAVIAVDARGDVFCAGGTYTSLGELDMMTFKIRADGTRDWVRLYNYLEDDKVLDMAIDEFSNVYVTASSEGYEIDWDWVTFKYNSQGSVIWYVRHSIIDEDDEPRAIAVDKFGSVYVSGYDAETGSEDYATIKYSEYDVGAWTVVEPADTFRLDAKVNPEVWVRNYSAIELTFVVRLEIGNFYFDAANAVDLAPYDSVLIEFAQWDVRDIGTHQVRCYTMLSGDREPQNDTSYGSVTAVYPWEQLPSLPAGPRGREIKDGGALAFCRDTLVFAFKGNNTTEFYRFNILDTTWTAVESIPSYGSTLKKKRIKKGARLETVGDQLIYAVKGNNTFEFWRYGVDSLQGWTEVTPIPSGVSGRKVKGGTGLNYIPSLHELRFLKGSNTLEFYGYSVAGDSWFTLASVPPGPKGKRAKYGSCTAFDGDHTIYMLKGRTRDYEFYAYDILRDTWVAKTSLRDSRFTGRRRKVKKGAWLAYDPEFDKLYATKGGKTTEFWYYDPARDTWVETTDTIPVPSGYRKTRLPYRGAVGEYGKGKIYVFTGNKTLAFYRFHANYPLEPGGGFLGPQAEPVQAVNLRLVAAPNPFRDATTISYSLPFAGRVRLAVYDIAGRTQHVLVDDWQSPGDYHVTLRDKEMAAGIYFAKLLMFQGHEHHVVSRKLLLTR